MSSATALREVRPRLHRPRSAGEDRQKTQRKKVTFAWNGEDVADVMRHRCSSRASRTSSSTCRFRTTPRRRTTRCWARAGRRWASRCSRGYSYNERSMLSLGVVDHDVEIGTDSRWFGARRTAARRSRRSSATSRRKSARWSARCRIRRSSARRMRKAGGRRISKLIDNWDASEAGRRKAARFAKVVVAVPGPGVCMQSTEKFPRFIL